MRGFFSGESLFLIGCSGHDGFWFNTYGVLLEIDVLRFLAIATT